MNDQLNELIDKIDALESQVLYHERLLDYFDDHIPNLMDVIEMFDDLEDN